jgi:curved DNA-binding protein CbpA
MTEQRQDYYEILQVSPNAEQDTIQRVYRLLAQRFHPDNQQTGSSERFRLVHEAYEVLNDPERRAQYDVNYHQIRQDRLNLVSEGQKVGNDFELEQYTRLTVLQALYTQRKVNPQHPGIFDLDFENLTGTSREHLEFTFWYLMQKGLVKRGDDSRLVITGAGVDFLESHYESILARKRLREVNEPAET